MLAPVQTERDTRESTLTPALRGVALQPVKLEPTESKGDGDGTYPEMMARFLGDVVMEAFANDDVTEIYVNPQDGRLRFDTRSQGRVDGGFALQSARLEMFLNAAAARLNTTLSALAPRIEAELPVRHFRGSRLQGFVPPATALPSCTIRKPPAVVYTLDEYVAAGILDPAHCAAFRDAVAFAPQHPDCRRHQQR